MLSYDKLLIATGAIPRQLEVPGKDLQNIFTLRSYHDSKRILEAAEKVKNVTVVGSSFIGMEVAFSLLQHDKYVTVISPDQVPFAKTFGEEIGTMFKNQHEQMGTQFINNARVSGFKGNEQVHSVEMDNGDTLATEMVVIGIGVDPATNFVKGLPLLPDKSIQVDEYLQAADDVYAAGDIATYPDKRTGESTRIEHWRVALQQGHIAGRNMAGHQEQYTSIPFFWTRQAGISFGYVGFARNWDELVIDGDLQEQDFLAYFIQNNQLLAVAGNKRSKEMNAINLLMSADKLPGIEAIRRKKVDWLEMV